MSVRHLAEVSYWSKDDTEKELGCLVLVADVDGTVTDSQIVDTLVRAAEKIGNCKFVLEKPA